MVPRDNFLFAVFVTLAVPLVTPPQIASLGAAVDNTRQALLRALRIRRPRRCEPQAVAAGGV